jgi:hypothetical protein
MSSSRDVAWEGFFNARDLGGLLTRHGGVTRDRALIRSADPRFVTRAGWRQAYQAGVRTIVDLRNNDEIRPGGGTGPTAAGGSAHFAPDPAGPHVPPGMRRIHVPLDHAEDTGFWRYLNDEGFNGTPLYFRPFLQRKPERCAAAVTAIARARPGGVIFHCAGGRDRTGLIALLVLALADVEPAAIAADYEMSRLRLPPLFAALGRTDDGQVADRLLARRQTTVRAAVLSALEGFDVEDYLRLAGVAADDLAAIRSRLAP